MPHQPSNLLGPVETQTSEKPKEPGLGVLTGEGTVSVIPKGGILAIIDPKHNVDSEGVVLMAIARFDRHGMVLICPCGQKHCSRKLTAQFTWKGTHPNSRG